ncbi:hypothetical protein MT418_000812 [Batrachochytrium dendrobatidis]
MQRLAVLFKDTASQTTAIQSSNLTIDPYQIAFSNHGFQCFFVPVLQSSFCNTCSLASVLKNPASTMGLIFTSKNAALAVCHYLQTASISLDPEWFKMPVYSVGASTSIPLRSIGFHPIGESTGNAAELAKLIVSDLVTMHGSLENAQKACTRPWTFFVGDKTRDVLSVQLQSALIPLQCIKVYEMKGREDVLEHLEYHVSDLFSNIASVKRPDFDLREIWLVFFSPSGIDVVLQHGLIAMHRIPHVHIACIGKTTADHACSVGLCVSAVATRPTPDMLMDAIVSFYKAL